VASWVCNLLASFGLRSFVAASRLRGSNQGTTPFWRSGAYRATSRFDAKRPASSVQVRHSSKPVSAASAAICSRSNL
jgi:hypothetical protein